MKYVQPLGDADPNASYVNPNPGGGVDGSPVPAAAIEHTMREIVAVITAASLTPTDANLDQLLAAIQALIAAGTQDSFAKSIHVRDEKASGTGGGTVVIDTWTERVLNTVMRNTISGASLSSNRVMLPAGTYVYHGRAPASRSGTSNPTIHKARLKNVTDTTYVYGTSEFTTFGTTFSEVSGAFTIAASKVFSLEHHLKNFIEASATALGGAMSLASVIEVYSDLKFWKVG